MPIRELSCYSGRWAIKARVTSKGQIRPFRNSKNEGKLFSIDLLDADGGEIRGIIFTTISVDEIWTSCVSGIR